MRTETITVIIPCFNEEEALPVYYQAMQPVMKQMENIDFELLFIDDGSTDHTLLEMKALHQKDPRCKYFSFSRNFGKEAAIYAGLSNAGGDYVAVMDVDLQDPPALLPQMYKILAEEEYDSVATRRSDRVGEPKLRSFLSETFYKVINRISKTEIVRGARDFRLMKRKMVDAVLKMSEYNRFSKGIFEWVGFRTKWMEYENIERSAGETKWSLRKLFVYSMEGITGFSVIIVRTLIWGDPVSGWPSLACIIFMVSGVQLLCTGIVGQYLSKTYLETKHRPIFILKDSSEEETRTHYEYEH